MASLAKPQQSSLEEQVAPSEDALFEAFSDLLDTMEPEDRKGLVADLRANAEAHGA